MTILEAIILGIVQGLTEFLPISSSGHLVLLSKFFGIGGDFIFFSVTLHLVTLLAVVFYFRKDFVQIIKHPFSPLSKKIFLSAIPTIILVLIFLSFIENSFGGSLLPFSFMFTAILLDVTQIVSGKTPAKNIDYKASVFMGFMQGIAVIPGISRSGSTICTGVIMGYDRTQSARFSFLMSVPIIFASMIYETIKLFQVGGGLIYPLQTIIASIFAFVVGIFSIKLMLWIVKSVKFYWFSIYLVALAVISFILI